MKYNFSTIEIKDLNGKKIEGAELHKNLANLIYVQTKDLDMVEKAREINLAKEVEMDKTEIEEIKRLIESPEAGLAAFAKKALFDYLDSVK
jgi:hypothetical protein